MGDKTATDTAILIATSAEADGRGAEVLCKRFAGEQIFDRQLSQLAASGHHRVIVYADPADSVARTLWSSRRDGPIELCFATSGSDLVAALGEQSQLTLVAHGTLWQDELMAASVKYGPLIATHAGEDKRQGFERIDADSVWSGLAVLPAQIVVDTARHLGDWDFQATILRKAVQAGTPRMPAPADLVGSALDEAEINRFVTMHFKAIGAYDDQILTPLSRSLLAASPRWIAERIDNPMLWLSIGAGVLTLAALVLAWFFPGPWVYAPLLLAAPMVSVRQFFAKLKGGKTRLGAGAFYGVLALVSAVYAFRAILPDARPAALFVFTMALITTGVAALFSGRKPGLPSWWRMDSMIMALILTSSLVGVLRGFAIFSLFSLIALFMGEEARARFHALRNS